MDQTGQFTEDEQPARLDIIGGYEKLAIAPDVSHYRHQGFGGKVGLITDGRLSSGICGACVGPASAEAAEGSVSGLLQKTVAKSAPTFQGASSMRSGSAQPMFAAWIIRNSPHLLGAYVP